MHEIIKNYQIKAKKSLWQNFLVDENVLNKIATATETENENILEIGPGYWALTEKLLNSSPKSLTLIELDQDMVNILNDRISKNDLDITKTEFKIENIDVLKYTPNFWDYKVIANIPYYITSPILQKFLYDVETPAKTMVILMQKDVWDKILSDKSSVLSLFIKKKCLVSQITIVPNTCFVPPPKVQSSVLKFDYISKYEHINDKKFLDFIKKCFAQPRKKLLNNLSSFWYSKELISEIINKYSLWENIRADDLSLDQIIQIMWEF